MQYKLFAIFLLTAFVIVQAQVSVWNCSELCSREMRCGKGIGANDAEADKNAKLAIADAIYSSVRSIAQDILSVEENNGELNELGKYIENTTMERELKNANVAKLGCNRRYKDMYGNIVAEWYIRNSAAAEPYLNELKHLKDSLKISVQKINRETCRGMVEVYNKIRLYEGIVENLGQMDKSLKKEYDAFYEKMKSECAKTGRGVYIKSDFGYIKKETGSHLTKNGCWLSPTEEEANLILVLDTEEDVKSSYGMFYCNVSVGIDLQNGKTGKSIGNGNIKEKGSYTDKETACKEAGKKAAVEIWDNIKEKIQKEGCK